MQTATLQTRVLVSSKVLHKALQPLLAVVDNNPIIPALEYLHGTIGRDKQSIRFRATNLVATLETTVPVEYPEYSPLKDFLVEARPLVRFLAVIPEQPIALDIEDNRFKITTDDGTFIFTADCEPGDFPKLPSFESVHALKLDTGKFARIIETLTPYASGDEMRPAMCCINFVLSERKLTAVACDGYTLAALETETDSNLDVQFLIQRAQLKPIVPILKRYDDVSGILMLSPTMARISAGRYTYTCRLTTENYPDWQQAIPKITPSAYEDSIFDLQSKLKQAKFFEYGITKQLVINFRTTTACNIKAVNLDTNFEANLTLRGTFIGEPTTVGINRKFFERALTTLKSFKQQRFLMQFESATRPILFAPDEIEGFTLRIIVMPALNAENYTS